MSTESEIQHSSRGPAEGEQEKPTKDVARNVIASFPLEKVAEISEATGILDEILRNEDPSHSLSESLEKYPLMKDKLARLEELFVETGAMKPEDARHLVNLLYRENH